MLELGFTSATPYLFKGEAASWPAVKLWSPSFLATRVGDKLADVLVSDTGTRDDPPGGRLLLKNVRVSEAIEWIEESEKGGPRFYIKQISIRKHFPELLADLKFPDRPSLLNIWFGSAGNKTELHFDHASNYYLQIYGRKKFILLDPAQSEFVYRRQTTEPNYHISPVDIEKPDFKRFPKLAHAQTIEIDVTPGDILYIPREWWHFVSSETISISVSEWCS